VKRQVKVFAQLKKKLEFIELPRLRILVENHQQPGNALL
jgi:hypothetical protein